MAESTARGISDALLHLSKERGVALTNLKLQKLLYYAQAWRLTLRGTALFDERIEAWVHGPVVPKIFRLYKHLKWNPIPDLGRSTGSPSIERHLEEVWNAYGHFDATTLERLTHKEEPWASARRGIPVDEPSHTVVSHDSMKKYYSKLLSRRAS